MAHYVFSGKKRILLRFPRTQDVTFLHPEKKTPKIPAASVTASIREFLVHHEKVFSKKKVCVVIPDNTRVLPSKKMLMTFSQHLQKLNAQVEFMVSLGLHKPLLPKELQGFLGADFCQKNRVTQHDLERTVSLGKIRGVPATIHESIPTYDALITIGIVEPHLYAGFSGGPKCVGIGLAGRETILTTHSVKYLSKKGVQVASLRNNPFQRFLWDMCGQLSMPVYSCNMVLNENKEIAHCFLGKAEESFMRATRVARKVYSYPVKGKFDLLFVGCDSPKDRNLYQASRLFNYVLEKRPLVKKGGAILVFANLDEPRKSAAEKNFEECLAGARPSVRPSFSRPGEHRAFKVLQATETARCGIITGRPPKRRFDAISFFETYEDALRWGLSLAGDHPRIGVIPLGFSFIPSA